MLRSPALAAAVAGLALLAAAPAEAKTAKACKSTDLQFPFMPGGPKFFGVHKLKVTGGTCATAHRVAKDWKKRFEANLHKGSEVCIDDFEANRAPDHRYRTTPLNGLWTHMKRGFYHDGRFPTLLDVVNHYDTCFGLGLSSGEKNDLVEYLKSLPSEESDTSAVQ